MISTEKIELVAKVLARCKFPNVMDAWSACTLKMKDDFRMDAYAILYTLLIESTTEYALQMKTYTDGDFDRTFTYDTLSNKPFTLEQITDHPWLNPKSPVPTRAVTRQVSDWVEMPKT